MTTSEDDNPSRYWILHHDAGRVLASALARLINTYEISPERAQHALSWEHLPGRVGSRYPISERDESNARKYSDSAQVIIETSMLHDGRGPLSEYSQLLDDWDLIHPKADEDSFKLDEFVSQNDSQWEVTGKGMTDAEKRQFQGWSTEDVERLRSRDPELLSEYRQELEKEAVKQAEKGRDYIEWEENRKIWVEARLADLESAANAKMLAARVNDLDVQRSRWEAIERMRPLAENQGRNLLFKNIAENADSGGLTLPERPAEVEWHFPDCLTPEVRIIYDATEQKRRQLWTMPTTQEVVDEYEELVGRLVALSNEMPTTPAIAKYMEWNEEERTSTHRSIPRLPIQTEYGWPEYYGLVLDDEAYLDREIREEVRKSGNLWIHWAKELVGMLPAIANRSVEFGKHPILNVSKDSVPESLSALFEQAHLCYLFNLEIPCVVTCGSLIEEAIETKFPELRDKWEVWSKANDGKQVGWKFKRMDVLEIYPHFERVSKRANSVVYRRNDAVHNPEKFLSEHRGRQASILRSTRDVLENLFEAKDSDQESNPS